MIKSIAELLWVKRTVVGKVVFLPMWLVAIPVVIVFGTLEFIETHTQKP